MNQAATAENFSALFLGKAGDARCEHALALVRERFAKVTAMAGGWAEPLPNAALEWSGDLVISYLSRWVVPARVLAAARVAAINFHPGSPEYPGFGCYNWALYEESREYGVTCHYMRLPVDSGDIVAVRRFPITPTETVESLLAKTHAELLVLLEEMLDHLATTGTFPISSEKWQRPPFCKRQLEELHRVTPTMEAAEVGRRIRAVTIGKWRAYVELHGERFEHVGKMSAIERLDSHA
jgi:methionyl-tRNA formyltransferase